MYKLVDMTAHYVHGREAPDTLAPTDSIQWHDKRRYVWLYGLLVPVLPFGAYGLAAWTGSDWGWFSGPVWVLGVIPFFDWVRKQDTENPPESAYEQLDKDRYYRIVIMLYIPLQYAGLIWSCYMWAYGGLSTFASLGLAVTVAFVAGIGINTAHELGHKHPALERWLAKVALAQSCYGHFVIEHNRGHHSRVSTPEDPASSRLGESFWEFLPRTILGSLRSAIHLERARCTRIGQGFWSPKNEILNAWAMSVVLYGTLIGVFGWSIVPWLAIQIVLGFSLLEVVNYVEHYGLLRQKRDAIHYERTRPEHSWNSAHKASNAFLYQLQRHSDHHANPTRRYQNLRHFEEAPQLPQGYAGMIVLAMCPPLWRAVMDKRVLAHYGGDLSLVNIHPRTRERVLLKYGSGNTLSAS